MKFSVLFVTRNSEEEILALKSALLPCIDLTTCETWSAQAASSACDGYDAVVGDRLPPEIISSPRLRFVLIPFAGIPLQDAAAFRSSPAITLMNSHFNCGYAAEHALGLMIAAARRLAVVHDALRNGDWRPRYDHEPAPSLFGATVLVAGTGHLCCALAGLLLPFSCRLIGVNTDGRQVSGFHQTTDRRGMLELLPQALFVTAALPLGDATRGFFGKQEFAAFQPGTVFVNVGRGPTVDEGAFVDALRSGLVGAAGIDTWWNYPQTVAARASTLPCSFNLSEFPQVVCTPHKATHVAGREFERMRDIARVLNAAAQGCPVNVVKISEGY